MVNDLLRRAIAGRRRAGPQAEPSLLRLVHEDWIRHGRSWTRSGFHAVAVHRLGAWRLRHRRLVRNSIRPLYGGLYFVVRNLYGIELSASAKLGRRVEVTHQGGIVVVAGTVIGDDCVIRQNVTIGLGPGGTPRIGNNVEVSPGAVVVGAVRVGEGARIGPNAVVMTDVPEGGRAIAPAARVTGPLSSSMGVASPLPNDELHRSVSGPPPDVEDVEKLIGHIRATVRIREPLSADTPLFTSGLVDSLNVAVLLDALEEAYGVSISAEDVSADSFDTPLQILAVVQRQLR
jgi:serine O-acetyltransferase